MRKLIGFNFSAADVTSAKGDTCYVLITEKKDFFEAADICHSKNGTLPVIRDIMSLNAVQAITGLMNIDTDAMICLLYTSPSPRDRG